MKWQSPSNELFINVYLSVFLASYGCFNTGSLKEPFPAAGARTYDACRQSKVTHKIVNSTCPMDLQLLVSFFRRLAPLTWESNSDNFASWQKRQAQLLDKLCSESAAGSIQQLGGRYHMGLPTAKVCKARCKSMHNHNHDTWTCKMVSYDPACLLRQLQPLGFFQSP